MPRPSTHAHYGSLICVLRLSSKSVRQIKIRLPHAMIKAENLISISLQQQIQCSETGSMQCNRFNSVQSELLDSIDLKSSSKTWKRIMHGLPVRQMSFILQAVSDTLPTPLNLARWRIQVDPKYPLCGNPRLTTVHVLNWCQANKLWSRVDSPGNMTASWPVQQQCRKPFTLLTTSF